MQEISNKSIIYMDFIFVGFSGPKEWRQLLFFPFLLMFLISTIANILLIYIILSQRSLHAPMYFLIGAIACVDLTMPILIVPQMLFNLLFNWNYISLVGCLLQMFCIYFFGSFQSTVLLWMALDRYYAICKPLHYNDYVTVSAIIKFILVPVVRNFVISITVVGLARSLSYCQYEISHCFCDHMALVTLACGPIKINSIVGLIGVFSVLVLDFLIISVSYFKIFFTLFKSKKSSQKAFSTCVSHIIVMIVSLVFSLTGYLSYRIQSSMSLNSLTVISTMALLFPSCLNPIIYGIRTKEIRQQIIKIVKCGRITPQH